MSRILRAASIYQRLSSGAHAVAEDGVSSPLRNVKHRDCACVPLPEVWIVWNLQQQADYAVKGTYQFEAKRSVKDYRINVRRKSKNYHINLLKRYEERAKDGETVKTLNRNPMMVGVAVLEMECSAIIEDDESYGSADASEDNELLDLGASQADKSWAMS